MSYPEPMIDPNHSEPHRPTVGLRDEATDPVEDLISYLAASPSPFHATANGADALRAAGFADATAAMDGSLPRHGFVRQAGVLIAWSNTGSGDGEGAASRQSPTGFRILGAHSDSPNLRLRPHPDRHRGPWLGAGVEVYGGALLNSWLDRDLGISGRLYLRGSGDRQPRTVLVRTDEPLMRVPQLAIHLDRGLREGGLVLNPQEHVQPVWGYGSEAPTLDLVLDAVHRSGVAMLERQGQALEPVSERIDVDEVDGFDLMAHPCEPPRRLGRLANDGLPQLLASARLDNLVSCWCAIGAIRSVARTAGSLGSGTGSVRGPVAVAAIFDNEEVGSDSMHGAGGQLLERVLLRLSDDDPAVLNRELAHSVALSLDMSHAVHPNYPDRHEPAHVIRPGGGPAIKVNSSQRYATNGAGVAYVRSIAREANLPIQVYSHRGDLPCGSTIGPILSTGLSVPTIDVGAPQLSMHSAREMMACADLEPTAQLAAAFLSCVSLPSVV